MPKYKIRSLILGDLFLKILRGMFAVLIPLIMWLPRGSKSFNYWGQYQLFLIKATKMMLCSEGYTAELKYS